MIYDKEKRGILLFEIQLEKQDEFLIIRMAADYFSVDWLNVQL